MKTSITLGKILEIAAWRRMLLVALFLTAVIFSSRGQAVEKIVITKGDVATDYYLVVRPLSGKIKGVLVLFSSFDQPETIFPETKLDAVASENDILTVAISMNQALAASPVAIKRINEILQHIITKYSADPKTFVLGGFDMSGMIILRYAELAVEKPAEFAVIPKAIFTVDSPTDLIGFWHYCEREIRKNFLDTSVKDAQYFIDQMTKDYGTIYNNLVKYVELSPFTGESHVIGHEQYLKKIPLRLYYDTDINWQLKNRRRGYYDTHMPGGSELVNRLLLEGNDEAEFIEAKTPGVRGSGTRHPQSWSIVDEPDCIQWMKEKIGIFDLKSWVSPYKFNAPEGWTTERILMPLEFAPQIPYSGVEDVRFAPGWSDKTREDYWSYTFMWWMDGAPVIDEKVIDNDLTAYYSGLIAANIDKEKMPVDKIPLVKVAVKKIKTLPGDASTFSAVVQMTDYMSLQPIKLNAIAHSRKCTTTQNKSIVLFEISPQPASHAVWKQLSSIGSVVVCD